MSIFGGSFFILKVGASRFAYFSIQSLTETNIREQKTLEGKIKKRKGKLKRKRTGARR